MGMIDLKKPEHAYFFGLLQSDGTFYETTRNRGRISLELKRSDSAILKKLSEILPIKSSIHHRDRDTNFKKNYHSDVLYIFDLNFREEMKLLGLPVGKKHKLIKPPEVLFSEADYYRGLVDGDGSIGFTAKGYPFVSFVTSSYKIMKSYISYIEKITGKLKRISRNKRDNVFNICLLLEDAQEFLEVVYYKNCLSISRKYELAQSILDWKRKIDNKRISKKNWQSWEDEIVLENVPETASKILKRSVKSVSMRFWRLKHENDK